MNERGRGPSEPDIPHDDADDQVHRMWRNRLWSRFVLMYLCTAWSAVFYFHSDPPVGQAVPALLVVVVIVVCGTRTTFYTGHRLLDRLPFWPAYFAVLAGCLGLVAFAGPSWIFTAAWATAATGWLGGRWFGARLVSIGLAVALIGYLHGYNAPLLAWSALMIMTVGLFSNQARRQLDLFVELRESRRELARMAVMEERDRIARDLHDLVGHSLSVIAVKNELSRRLLRADPERAERELTDIDGVVRRALSEVRQAVTNYRRPTLAAELASVRRAAASAGIDCRVDSPASWQLPATVDGLLAWVVREGVTNVLRHSGADHCTITLRLPEGAAEVEITDDGTGPPGDGHRGGNGLVGLTERARALGGTLTVSGPAEGGFRLSVRVPT